MQLLRIASALSLALFLAACLGSPGDRPQATAPSEDQPSVPADGGEGRRRGNGKGGPDKKSGKKDPGGSSAGETAEPGSTSPGSEGNASEGAGATSGDPATGSARVLDSSGDADASGGSPPYTDMLEARVEGRGRTLRLTASFRGIVPQRMDDDDTFMSVETTIHKGGSSYSVYADGNDDGWTAYLSHKDNNQRLEGAFSLEGDTMAFEIPWGLIGGPGPFRWTARSAWTRTTLTNTYFAFDNAPEGKKARYPQ